MQQRPDGRSSDQIRSINFDLNVAPHASGSVLVAMGNTRVICAASVEDKLPPHLRYQRTEGWVTAEYGMLPRSTHTRSAREIGRGGPSGRTHEIQRLIGRSLRAIANRKVLGERTITLDCDVLQADGGTRTAAITGACLATSKAFAWMMSTGRIGVMPVKRRIAAVSVGLISGEPRLDLDYPEDVAADVDMNVVMSSEGRFVEVQGTGEHASFSRQQLDILIDLAERGITELFQAQRKVLGW